MHPVSFFRILLKGKKINQQYKMHFCLSWFSREMIAQAFMNAVSLKKDICGCLGIDFYWDGDIFHLSHEEDFG